MRIDRLIDPTVPGTVRRPIPFFLGLEVLLVLFGPLALIAACNTHPEGFAAFGLMFIVYDFLLWFSGAINDGGHPFDRKGPLPFSQEASFFPPLLQLICAILLKLTDEHLLAWTILWVITAVVPTFLAAWLVFRFEQTRAQTH